MILGIGVDVVDVERFTTSCLERPGMLDRLVSPMEQEQPRPAGWASLAGRFAAKEAVAKALGTGFVGFGPLDIVVERASGEGPKISLRGGAAAVATSRGVRAVRASISHDGGIAVAVAVAV